MGCKSSSMIKTQSSSTTKIHASALTEQIVAAVAIAAPVVPTEPTTRKSIVIDEAPVQVATSLEAPAVADNAEAVEAPVEAPVAEDVPVDLQAAPEQPEVSTEAAEEATPVAAVATPFGERAPSVANVFVAASPKTAAPISFSEYVAEAAAASTRKVAFDAETMRKTAPKSVAEPKKASKLSKKQKEMMKKNHVSAGRRGPVASKWDKGGKANMQDAVYLEMAAAFERLLTNAATIDAHLDSR